MVVIVIVVVLLERGRTGDPTRERFGAPAERWGGGGNEVQVRRTRDDVQRAEVSFDPVEAGGIGDQAIDVAEIRRAVGVDVPGLRARLPGLLRDARKREGRDDEAVTELRRVRFVVRVLPGERDGEGEAHERRRLDDLADEAVLEDDVLEAGELVVVERAEAGLEREIRRDFLDGCDAHAKSVAFFPHRHLLE